MCTALVLMKLKQISFLYLSLGIGVTDVMMHILLCLLSVTNWTRSVCSQVGFARLVFLNPFKFREENKVMK